MRIGSIIAIYFVVWWTVLFAVLPWGNRSQLETGVVAPGSAPSAPAKPRLVAKALATSLLSAVLVALLVWARSRGWSLEDLPSFGPH